MNNVTPEKKQAVLKSLAIFGFIGIIIFIAWLSVQIVSLAPSAFQSLASIAESVYGDRSPAPNFVVTSDKTMINAGENVTLSWTTATTPGSYVLSYECSDGVAIDITSGDGVRNLNCDNNYNLGNVDSVTLSIASEKSRYTDIKYTLSFLKTNDTTPRYSTNGSVSVVNPNIAPTLAEGDTTSPAPEAEVEAPAKEVVTEPTVSEPAPRPTQPTPTYTEEYIYQIPVSNPNGYTDLSIRYLGIGNLNSSGAFTPSINLIKNTEGALQFEVKNIGTKTSAEWTFSAVLPGIGTYTSDTQTALRPNERSVLTISFPVPNQARTYTISATTKTAADNNPFNDNFTWSAVVLP